MGRAWVRSRMNRLFNRDKSTEEIDQQIAERQAEGRPTKQLEDERAARDRRPRQVLEAEKRSIAARGGWTGPTNRAINRQRSTSEIDSLIASRRAQGKPVQQLLDERATRSDDEEY